jgi:heptosyltransferase-2
VGFADNFLKENKLTKRNIIIGINTGSGKIFANKNLDSSRITGLIKLLKNETNAELLLLGGPFEREINCNIIRAAGRKIIDGGCDNNLREFSALVNICAVVITADTLALHIAIALKKPVVALFGPTCHQEIDLYGLGHKIITPSTCAPCYRNECDKKITCMDDIDLHAVARAAKKLIKIKG